MIVCDFPFPCNSLYRVYFLLIFSLALTFTMPWWTNGCWIKWSDFEVRHLYTARWWTPLGIISGVRVYAQLESFLLMFSAKCYHNGKLCEEMLRFYFDSISIFQFQSKIFHWIRFEMPFFLRFVNFFRAYTHNTRFIYYFYCIVRKKRVFTFRLSMSNIWGKKNVYGIYIFQKNTVFSLLKPLCLHLFFLQLIVFFFHAQESGTGQWILSLLGLHLFYR